MKLSFETSERHPTEHTLLRFHAGDLSADREAQIQSHVSACSTCSGFLGELDSFKDEFASAYSRSGFLASIKQKAEKEANTRAPLWNWLSSPSHRLVLGVCAASLLVLVLFLPFFHSESVVSENTIRVKGSKIGLSYLIMDQGKPILAKPGRILHPGDRIQFRLTAPRGGYVHIVGVDEAGHVTVYFPLPGTDSEVYPGGSGRPVPGSIILDDTLGKERVFVLLCSESIKREVLHHQVVAAARDPRSWISNPRLALECQQSSILLRKEPTP